MEIKSALLQTLVLVILLVLFAYPLMLLWNVLMPVIFNLPIINFWQALGILIMSNILFKFANIK